MRSTLALVLLLATLACEREQPTSDPTSPAKPPTSQPEAEPDTALPTFTPIVEPGPAYFAVRGRGVTRISEAGVLEVIEGAPTSASALAFGPDGALYHLDVLHVSKLEGERFVEQLALDHHQLGAAMQLAFGPDRSMWVRGTDGVGRVHEGRWTNFDRSALGISDASLVGLAVDREGRAWLATLAGLLYLDPAREDDPAPRWQPIGSRWSQHEGTFLGLIARADHHMYVVGIDSLDSFEPHVGLVARSYLPAGVEFLADSLAISSRGRLALGSSDCSLALLDPAREGSLVSMPGVPSWGCEALDSLAYDADDRVWVGSSAGVHVLDTKAPTFYRSGSFAPLAGRVEAIAVWSRGPTTLPSVPEPLRFRLRATILRQGKPVAAAPVEVCPALQLGHASPCAHSPYRATTTTDRKGKLELELPLGDYELAVQVEGSWHTLFQADFAAALREGEAHDLGVQELEP